MSRKLTSIVIVGRPNVGKSSLFNRITESRRSIVTDEPGITRDRIYGTAQWNGRAFELVDTGGLLPEDQAEIPREIFRQASLAIEAAERLVLVVDARAGVTPSDAELARLLRRTGKPFVIAANKVDDNSQASLAAPFFELAGNVYPVSAEHGYGVDELLDELTREMPEAEVEEDTSSMRVAIIGRPNVGKSTLLNRLAGSERSIVSAGPGTTRDAVATLVKHGDALFRFVDTAGIRRKTKTKLVAEKLSVMMAHRHLEQSDVALLLLDGSLGVTTQDAAIAGEAARSGRSVILVLNKWDLALEAHAAHTKKAPDPQRLREEYEKLIRQKLKFLHYAPILFVTASTGHHTSQLFDLIEHVYQARRRRISTGELNRWLRATDIGRGTSPAARRVKIFYITQSSSSPPTFVLFTNQTGPLHFSFQRYLENQLRASFDFLGTPIRFSQKLRKQ